jgi:hypothetical protein
MAEGGANIAVLPRPNQLDLAFVLKQQKPILIRQRLVGFDKRNQIPLLLRGKLVTFKWFSWARHGNYTGTSKW